MKLKMKLNTIILLIFSILTALCLFYMVFHVNTNLVDALNVYQAEFKTTQYLIAIAYFFVLIFHIWGIVYIFMHFRYFEKLKTLKIILLVIAVISLFSLGGEKVMIDEIAKQFKEGLPIPELNILNGLYVLNALFILSMLYLLLKTLKLFNYQSENSIPIDEKIFVIVQSLGVVAGVLGVLFVFHNIIFIDEVLLIDKYWVSLPFFLLFLTPYGLAILYWLSIKRKRNNWYDEKQLQDILKSSLITMLLSIPSVALFSLIKIPIQLYFVLFYIFLIILIFSSSTLYFFKLKDNY